jgi:hypothetical protein
MRVGRGSVKGVIVVGLIEAGLVWSRCKDHHLKSGQTGSSLMLPAPAASAQCEGKTWKKDDDEGKGKKMGTERERGMFIELALRSK